MSVLSTRAGTMSVFLTSIPSIEHMGWHIVNAQEILLNEGGRWKQAARSTTAIGSRKGVCTRECKSAHGGSCAQSRM